MHTYVYIGAALLALLASLPALAFKEHWNVIRRFWADGFRNALWDLVSCELGAVTVNYFIRGGNTVINNSVTGPTTAQAAQVVKQSAVCVFGTVDDIQALFTHNWGLDLSAGPFFEPEILVEPISTGTTSWPMLTFWRLSSNVLSVNKRAGDKETTVQITLRKPHSTGM